ncbi:ribosomal maturation YjgA family protein [Neobacillus sp. Marseille-QA0830]
MPISKRSNTKSFKIRNSYLMVVFLLIVLGLASRKLAHLLPVFIAENAGDTIWAMMVYFGFRFLLANQSLSFSFLLSFAFSFSVEFSQLYQADWMNQIRGTVLGALILGHGFLWVDLLRYTIGILAASLIDKWVFKN